MDNGKRSIEAVCPDCGEKFSIRTTPEVGQRITCPNCWAYLQVMSLNPLVLEWDSLDPADEEFGDDA